MGISSKLEIFSNLKFAIHSIETNGELQPSVKALKMNFSSYVDSSEKKIPDGSNDTPKSLDFLLSMSIFTLENMVVSH